MLVQVQVQRKVTPDFLTTVLQSGGLRTLSHESFLLQQPKHSTPAHFDQSATSKTAFTPFAPSFSSFQYDDKAYRRHLELLSFKIRQINTLNYYLGVPTSRTIASTLLMSWDSWVLGPILIIIIMSYIPPLLSSFAQSLGWNRNSSSLPSSSSSSSVPSTKTSDSSPSPNGHNEDPHTYKPSAMDVVVTKMMLAQGLHLPAEVVLSILDFAEYWPHTSATLDSSFITMSGGHRENKFVVSLKSKVSQDPSLTSDLLTRFQLRTKPLGLIKPTQQDDHQYTFTCAAPLPLSDDAEYPVSQFQTWIGGPTDTIQHPCRRIVFTITSHDQGWSNTARQDRGSYRGSYTWFEAGLERFDKTAVLDGTAPDEKAAVAAAVETRASHAKVPMETTDKSEGESSTGTAPNEKAFNDKGDSTEHDSDLSKPFPPHNALRPIYPTVEPDTTAPALHFDLLASPQYTIQYNKTATRTPTTHIIVWSWTDDIDPPTPQQLREIGRGEETGTGEFVRNLKLGDVVTVWAKSRFGGWANHVDAVKVDVYWAL